MEHDMSFGGGGKPPDPQPAPAPPTKDSEEVKQARAKQMRAQQLAKGYSSTIATSGVMTNAGQGQLV
jgi:hypothetical protein